ncbi:N-acetylmuramoyl-L-alanine amidase [Paenalkalicoccus suaedae]|uniref:Autolysin n=1 Tax=Paenalkalicoccus suaedae TaxID=2592382 RepID=A0A859FFU9_9BACI|nr:N-acetylmuramoyl-L-alanine amidase [Paenalkalicoccus suaedae]QKS71891.1 N-acetylmuramoyl-L-alanine amidase [Paenalkalicoccus suaedae]
MTKTQDIRSRTPKRSSRRQESDVTVIARHHSATDDGDFDTFWNYWKTLEWITGGYHEIILRDGTVQICYDANMVTNGVGNHNSYTYHICLVGNGSFTNAQEKAWRERCQLAMDRLKITVNNVKGHNEFTGARTACPGTSMVRVRQQLREALTVSNQPTNEPSPWARSVWVKATQAGIVDGKRPQEPMTRQEMAAMLDRLGLIK